MKKLFFSNLLVFVLVSVSLFGQTEKGSVLLGGSANLTTELKNNSGFHININPKAGLFLAKNFAFGTSLPSGFSTNNYSNRYYLGVSPFARYYFGQKKAKPFLEGEFGYYYTHIYDKATIEKSKYSYGRTYGSFGLGLAYFINEHIGLETLLNYSSQYRGVNLNLGFQIYLPKSDR